MYTFTPQSKKKYLRSSYIKRNDACYNTFSRMQASLELPRSNSTYINSTKVHVSQFYKHQWRILICLIVSQTSMAKQTCSYDIGREMGTALCVNPFHVVAGAL